MLVEPEYYAFLTESYCESETRNLTINKSFPLVLDNVAVCCEYMLSILLSPISI
jgi:hypothetical protein